MRAMIVLENVMDAMTLSTYQEISRKAMLESLCCSKDVLVLDCRSGPEFDKSHIRHAINVNIPALLLRRLATGKASVASIIPDRTCRERFLRACESHVIVLCGAGSPEDACVRSVISVLHKRLKQDGCSVFCLEGGFSTFRAEFPEWCESNRAELTIFGLQTLSLCASLSSGDGDLRESSSSSSPPPSSPHSRSAFPLEILPHLFLGDADTSEDGEELRRRNIKYILNVTADLPNVFEQQASMKYKQVPISDQLSEDMFSYFPESIDFIDEARDQELGVLVHCLAGVSRSVTITLAYLMHKLTLTLNEAFDLVRRKKSNISPNLTFMKQLQAWERHLRSSADECTCVEHRGQPPVSSRCAFHSPSPAKTSPDSGIDSDRWQ